MSTTRNNEGNGLGGMLFWVPILLVIMFFTGAAWFAAVKGKSYSVVRAWVFPFTFVLTQFLGGMMFLCLGWFIGLLFGSKTIANYVVGNTSDLTMVGMVFGDSPTIPFFHIILFQVILWFIMGKHITRHVAFSIYDLAIQTIGKNEGEHPYYVREDIREYDTGYAEAEQFYAKSGKPPLLGLILVGMFSDTPIAEYY